MLLPQDPAIYAFTRSLDGVTLLVVANFTGEEQKVTGLPEAERWADARLLLGNYADADAAPLVLRPWEATVHRLG